MQIGIQAQVNNKLAYIITAAALVRKLLDIDLSVNKLADLLTNNEKESRETTDIYDEAFEFIKELVNTNLSRIYCKYGGSGTIDRTTNSIGSRYFDEDNNQLVIALSKRFVNSEMAKRGFNDRTKIIKELAHRGHIQRDKDHLGIRTNLGAVREYAYRFIFKSEDLYDDCETATKPTQTRRVVVSAPQEIEPIQEDESAIEDIFNEENKN